jgi:Spy/CpxP family protein refolding chaperone
MRKFLISAAVLSATAFAAPAAAQYSPYPGQYQGQYQRQYPGPYQGQHQRQYPGQYQDYRHGGNIEQQLQQLVQRIRRAEDRDVISRREEDRLLREASRIRELYYRYSRNGLTQREHYDLQNRIQHLRHSLRMERREDRRQDRRRDRRW